MVIKDTKSFYSKTLQNLPKLGFLVWKQTIWQPWRALGAFIYVQFVHSNNHVLALLAANELRNPVLVARLQGKKYLNVIFVELKNAIVNLKPPGEMIYSWHRKIDSEPTYTLLYSNEAVFLYKNTIADATNVSF
jgi:hypothetical protein